MGSINQSKSFLAHGSLPQEFTAGGSMIWLAVVGTLNQSNAITMMSLLWWGALTNQNHSWPTGVYCGSSPWEFTAGGYHGRSLWEFTTGVYHGRLPQEFTTGGSMIWLAVVGTLNQSNSITMMSLLWWGALTNQNHSWPMGVYCRRSPWEFTAEDHHGSLPWKITTGVYHGRSPWKFTMEDHRGRSLRKITVGVYHERSPREFTVEDHCRSLPWKITAGDHCGSLHPLHLPLVAASNHLFCGW